MSARPGAPKMPAADAAAVARFDRVRPVLPEVTVRKMFGQPAAFCNGQMFLGVFGDQVFLRLSEEDRAPALETPSAHLFAPMAGRPMREYVVLDPKTWDEPRSARDWIARSLRYARSLGPKRRAPARRA